MNACYCIVPYAGKNRRFIPNTCRKTRPKIMSVKIPNDCAWFTSDSVNWKPASFTTVKIFRPWFNGPTTIIQRTTRSFTDSTVKWPRAIKFYWRMIPLIMTNSTNWRPWATRNYWPSRRKPATTFIMVGIPFVPHAWPRVVCWPVSMPCAMRSRPRRAANRWPWCVLRDTTPVKRKKWDFVLSIPSWSLPNMPFGNKRPNAWWYWIGIFMMVRIL